MKRLLAILFIVLALALGTTAQKQQTHLSLAAESCSSGAACKTFRQMVKAGDQDVLAASWACFYIGHNPSEKDNPPSHDEFFLLMDAKAFTMKSGKHPGIFVNRIKNGIPDGFTGFGPEHGGLGEYNDNGNEINPEGKEVLASTYDDLGANIRWARFWFTSAENDPKNTYSGLGAYNEILMRKSTGRFTEKRITFSPFETTEYPGQCFQLGRK